MVFECFTSLIMVITLMYHLSEARKTLGGRVGTFVYKFAIYIIMYYTIVSIVVATIIMVMHL